MLICFNSASKYFAFHLNIQKTYPEHSFNKCHALYVFLYSI